jgi:hypothetical protein
MKCHKLAKVAKYILNNKSYDISCNNIHNDIEHTDDNISLSPEVGKYVCNLCSYITSKKYNYNKHLSSIKHKNRVANNVSYDYNCDICDYHTNKKYNYDKHIRSKKHCENIKNDNETLKNVNVFENELIVSTIMSQLNSILEENNKNILAEQTRLMVETQSKLMAETQTKLIQEIANKPTNNISNTLNNNQTNNQQFNLNMFLNETCKDAMNLSEFIENMQVTMEDMEKTGELGFAKGMSRIIMNNLNAIDVCKRPIHCSDVKRETLYVKNNGVWEKETDERNKTKEIIYKVSCLNVRQLLKWRDLPRNKGYEKSDHAKNDEFTNLVIEINKMREEEFDKIITSISKHVAIDKERVKMSGYLN